ncbi:flap endonuclease GEN homolog 1 isoform X1 [Ascaphus truei]|uniref:flap endonuclease GEN homolog 1 isoform X1 n=2 Tax=Ascaphus truei TaxID=8439 RepID=UPI003F598310
MGVHELWSILEPVKQHVPLHSLRGKTLAVDLSIWVCEAQTIKKMVGVVTKPHLRNLFFRVSSLSLMGVKLVFVSEGEAPRIKADTMSKRNEMRYGPSSKPGPARTGRSYFKSVLKECLQLLDCLGIPWVQAAGEAEAMCAYLNANGYVDGCITNDGDVFLYGARTVYRNFTMNVKDPHVDCYEVSSIKEKLGLDRDALVGLAIFLGCDYLPKGIPGVGKEHALKLIELLNGQSVLHRFYQWKKQFDDRTIVTKSTKKITHCSVCCHPGSAKDHERNGCKLCESDRYCEPHDYNYCCPCEWHRAEQEKQDNPVEYSIRQKARRCEGFPFHEIIQEFLRNKDKMVKVMKWVRPNLLSFQNFASERMEWPKHYACEKLLVLLTHYDLNERKAGREHTTQLRAIRIVKTRIRNGTSCFEIEWLKPGSYVFADDHPSESSPVTIEEESLFQAAYPQIVALFQKEKLEVEEKKPKGKKNKPKCKSFPDPDDVASLLSEMSLKSVSAIQSSPDSDADIKTLSGMEEEQEAVSHSSDLHFAAIPPPNKESLLDTETATGVSTTHQYNAGNKESVIDACSSPVQCNSQQLIAASPNITSLISELQLSSIDWEGTSFSKSPQVLACTDAVSCSEADELEEPFCHKPTTNKLEMIGGSSDKCSKTMVTQVRLNIPSVGNKPEYSASRDSSLERLQKLPLKERILLKNACQSGASYPQNLNVRSVPMKLLPLSLHKKDPTKSSSESSSATVSFSVGVMERGQPNKQKVPRELSQQEHREQSVLALKQMTCIDTNSRALGGPHAKSDPFVNDPRKIALLPVREVLDGNIGNRMENQAVPKLKVKKSVCHKGSSSSEENESEETGNNKYKYETQIKYKSSSTLSSSDSRIAKAKSKTEPGVIKSLFTTQNPTVVSLQSTCMVHSSSVSCGFHSLGQKSASAESEHSAEEQSDGDDSIVSIDSPLPLSERLKLRLLRKC